MSEFFFKSVNIWQSYRQERGCLMHFTRLANTLLKDKATAHRPPYVQLIAGDWNRIVVYRKDVFLQICLCISTFKIIKPSKCLWQVFVPMLVLGYTLFAAALFIRIWMLLLALRWEKVKPSKCRAAVTACNLSYVVYDIRYEMLF